MFSGLIAFLSGSAFRMIWGELSAWVNKQQDHKHEIEHMRLQSDLEKERHDRDCERLRLQSDLGVKEVQVQTDAYLSRVDADAFLQGVKDIGKQTGYRIIDIWNGAIRPLLATLAILIIVAEVIQNGFVLNDWHRDIVAAVIGLYLADRALAKRGK